MRAVSSWRASRWISVFLLGATESVVMGVGGTFDVVAGKVQRAPRWMQRWGLEWLYRVIQERRRMWKRYRVTILQFFQHLQAVTI